jgi:hypothetical protein
MLDPMNILDWLLEDDNPGVHYLVRRRLLGESSRSRRMTRLKRECNRYSPVARMLDRVDEAISTRHYKKYEGAFWTLTFLAEMQVDGRDRRARKLAEHVLQAQLDNGGFSAAGDAWSQRSDPLHFEIVCLTANVLRALVHFGYGDDERITRGYRRLTARIVPHRGIPCSILQYCLQTSCKMALPQTLRCLAVAPDGVPRRQVSRARNLLVDQLLGVRVYHYVPPDLKDYQRAVRTRPKGVRHRDVRDQWIAKRGYRNDQLLPKVGWMRFGFPRSYNPDLLEAMLALAELGTGYDAAMDDALDRIEQRRKPDGRWSLDESLNGKMLANVERKGRPSKWITLRALIVLAHFGRIEV